MLECVGIVMTVGELFEYGVNVWNSGLTKHQIFNIERVQKSSMKVIFGKNFTNYTEALKNLKWIHWKQEEES